MELVVLETQGIADNSLLSVRVGGTRRQGQLSGIKPFKFPCSVEECDAVKVEVLAVRGAARIPTPGGGPQTHALTFEAVPEAALQGATAASLRGPGAPGAASLSFRLQALGGGTGEASAEALQATRAQRQVQMATEADQYLATHSVLESVQTALKHLMRDRPEDPMAFLSKEFGQLQASPAAASEAPGGASPQEERAAKAQQLEQENALLRAQLAAVAAAISATPVPPAPAPLPLSPGDCSPDPLEATASNVGSPEQVASPSAEQQQRTQQKLQHEAQQVREAAVERAELMAEMGRLEAHMEQARTQSPARVRSAMR